MNMAHISRFVPHFQVEVRIGDRGRLVLPAHIREHLGIRAGDRLVLIADEPGAVRLVSLRKQVERFCGMLAGVAPKRVLSEELIAERREEARRE